MSRASSQNLTLVLGPTNTGKTHLARADDRLCQRYDWLPLAAVGTENYDWLVARLGADKVGLLTGEERILPRVLAI